MKGPYCRRAFHFGFASVEVVGPCSRVNDRTIRSDMFQNGSKYQYRNSDKQMNNTNYERS